MPADVLHLWAKDAVAELIRLQSENERISPDRAIRMQQNDRMAARIAELEDKVGRFQGIPLPLIEAINAATGSNDWQGGHSPAELLGPACKAIEAMDVEKTMPTIEDASQDWGKVDPAIAWHLIERHADSWADIGKMMTEYVQAQIARAELEARKPLPPADMTVTQHVNALVGDGLTAQKVEAICEREPYDVTGVVLSLPDGLACIVNQSAVRWFHGPRDFWELMHGRPS